MTMAIRPQANALCCAAPGRSALRASVDHDKSIEPDIDHVQNWIDGRYSDYDAASAEGQRPGKNNHTSKFRGKTTRGAIEPNNSGVTAIQIDVRGGIRRPPIPNQSSPTPTATTTTIPSGAALPSDYLQKHSQGSCPILVHSLQSPVINPIIRRGRPLVTRANAVARRSQGVPGSPSERQSINEDCTNEIIAAAAAASSRKELYGGFEQNDRSLSELQAIGGAGVSRSTNGSPSD